MTEARTPTTNGELLEALRLTRSMMRRVEEVRPPAPAPPARGLAPAAADRRSAPGGGHRPDEDLLCAGAADTRAEIRDALRSLERLLVRIRAPLDPDDVGSLFLRMQRVRLALGDPAAFEEDR